MADIQISGLPPQASVAGTNQIGIDDVTNVTYRMTLTQVLNYILTFINLPYNSNIISASTANLSPNTSNLITYSGGGNSVVTLLDTFTVGQQVQVAGNGVTNGWQIAQAAGQSIELLGTFTQTGTGGSLTSTASSDNVTLQCVTAGPGCQFVCINQNGNITIT